MEGITMFELFTEGLALALQPQNLLLMFVGTIMGLVFAAIPGLTFSTALVLLIPLTFNMDSVSAISILLGVFCAGMSGGSISAILLGIPGTPSAAATVLDGYPLTKKGQAGKALGMAVYASVFGGIFSLIILVLVAPILARVALNFGPVETFALVIFGLSTIISLSGAHIVKGLLAGFFGLLLTTIGLDPVMGLQRYTFGYTGLMNGIGIMPVMIGMFALPEVIETFTRAKLGEKSISAKTEKVKASFPSLREIKQTFKATITGAAIGTGIGSIPGTGGPIAVFLAYDQAKRMNPKCGTGELEGIAAPEAANNGVTGGAMIPLLTLGIPGDSATAIMLGALLIHGLIPGPLLFKDNGPIVYGIFISMLLVYVMVLFVQYFGIRLFVKVLDVPKVNLMAIIVLMSVVGAFATNLNYTDILIMFFAGFIAQLMRRYGFPVTPLILAVVLGNIVEDNFRKSLVLSGGNLDIFVTNPVSLVFLALAMLMILLPIIRPRIQARRAKKA